jgi:hypothetical protein
MIWILLLYVLPFVVSIILGYYSTKKENGTKGEYLKGVLIMLIPLINIVAAVILTAEVTPKLKIIQDIKEYLKQPL